MQCLSMQDYGTLLFYTYYPGTVEDVSGLLLKAPRWVKRGAFHHLIKKDKPKPQSQSSTPVHVHKATIF